MMKVIQNRKKYYAISIIVILIGLVFMVMNAVRGQGAFNQDIEFTGGSLIQVNMERPFNNELRSELLAITEEVTGDTGARITSAGDTGVLITMTREDASTRKELFEAIKEKYDLKDDIALRDEDFSPTISKDIKVGAIKAVVVGIALILVYVSFRFKDYRFGTSAVIALAHDVLVMLSVYAIFRIPLNNSFIAAMLTIVGYSINDTIVIFDRIRENKEKVGLKDHAAANEELVDSSINQTIGRSIATSLTTVVMVILLFALGTDSVKDFAFPLIIGILAGTYSSIFVASPIWYEFTHRKGNKVKQAKQIKKA